MKNIHENGRELTPEQAAVKRNADAIRIVTAVQNGMEALAPSRIVDKRFMMQIVVSRLQNPAITPEEIAENSHRPAQNVREYIEFGQKVAAALSDVFGKSQVHNQENSHNDGQATKILQPYGLLFKKE